MSIGGEQSGDIIAATDDTFDTLLTDARLVLVDYTASWCPPCRELHPYLAQFAADHTDSVAVVSVDVDNVRRPVVRHDVNQMPTLLMFDGGTPLLRLPGDISDLEMVVEVMLAYRSGGSLRSEPKDRTPTPARSFCFPEGADSLDLRLVPPDGDLTKASNVDPGQNIEVPEGWFTSLTVFPQSCAVDVLPQLPPDAIDSLDTLDPEFGDAALRALSSLTQLAVLDLREHQVSDRALLGLVELPRLRMLSVDYEDPTRSLDLGLANELQRANSELAVNNRWIHPALRGQAG